MYLNKKRYCGAPKAEITKRCTASLIDSMNHAAASLPHFDFELMIFDDHSDEETVHTLQGLLLRARFKTRFSALESRGIMPSILACYEYGKEHGKDLVYFAQDDYIFCASAITEMIEFDEAASAKLRAPVSIYPFNDPFRYTDVNNHEFLRMVQSGSRHWRTNNHTASCFMTHHSIIEKNWDLFYKMGTSEVSTSMERDSINCLWQKRSYFLFTPIPSLALHLQYDTEKDPFINWRAWWDRFEPTHTPTPFILPTEKKIVVNVGCGKSPLPVSSLRHDKWAEIRVDSDPEASPDILADMADVHQLPAHCADIIWASHVLEHVAWHELPKVVHEFLRLLKDDGIAIISVPDLQVAAEMITDDRLLDVAYQSPSGPITPLDMIYGYREFIRAGMSGMQHKTGFTASTLERVLTDLGFPYVVCMQRNSEIMAFASRSPLDPSVLRTLV